MLRRGLVTLLIIFVFIPLHSYGGVKELSKEDLKRARDLYDKYCTQCHGKDGMGDGPGADFFFPRPRDFSLAIFKFRSTSTESLPTDDDLLQTITEGLPSTGMPAFGEVLTRKERELLVEYIKGFSGGIFEEEEPKNPLRIGEVPPITEESVKRGRRLFEEVFECYKCHGKSGRGNGPQALSLQDDWGFPIYPRDLHKGWTFRRGSSRASIFNTVYNGIAGTPMPSFRDSFKDEEEARKAIWDVTNYVYRTFVQEKPRLKEAIKARLVEGEPPLSPDDPLWGETEAIDIPLVGQVIQEPRLFTPSIDTVTVRALHNRREMALLLEWDDRTESNPEKATIMTREGELVKAPLPDSIVVQWPIRLEKGTAKPYFLGGDRRRPTYQWVWSADRGAMEVKARGLGSETPLEGTTIQYSATYRDGQWRVVFKRKLTTDRKDRLNFVEGVFIPVAFNAMDGSNGEEGKKRSISTWYYIILEPPTPLRVYLFPPIALILGAIFELWLVRRVRRR